ncbi:MAG: copper-translocating P-type ATPase [Bacteroidetes bacterium 46-16]|nr:MAG: copper-translocating P-type ATPase [Bacteroidetes bacterium 46-16]
MSVETALKRYEAIKSVMVNLVHGIVLVEADTAKMPKDAIAEAVEKLGYTVSATEVQQYQTDESLFKFIKQRGAIGMSVSILDLLIDPLNLFGLPQHYRAWFSLAVATFVLFWVGFPILRKTIMAIRQRVINANVLLSTGAWGAFVIGILSLFNPAWPNFLPVAAWLMSLHLFFAYFKLDTRKKAADAVRKLLSLQPAKARVKRLNQWVEVLTTDVVVGETAEIKPGERIPLDGLVISGASSVDESSFTGESSPVYKQEGAEVIGGTMNFDGAIQIKVTKKSEDGFLNQIVRMMSQINEKKPPVELLADRLMNYYGPVVFIIAIVAALAWLLITGSVYSATIVLITTIIMGYPCALGITTPMLAAIAGGKGVSIGLLVKASEVFYGLSRVNAIVFDKTGTLTYGKPTVTNVVPLGISERELLGISAAVEEKSEHPLAQAITFYAKKSGVLSMDVTDFKTVAGKGVYASVNRKPIMVGSPRFLKENGVLIEGVAKDKLDTIGREGKTVIGIAEENQLIGLIALQDTPRNHTAEVMNRIKAKGIKIVMLTGDAKPVAEAVAKRIGINEVKAELLPIDKVHAIEELQQRGYKVAMVGDGINDAPALAQSDVGIAIGAGTDVAIESAGVILIGDKTIDVLNAVILGKASYRTLTYNVIIAVIFNIIGMILASLGLISPLLAIVVMIVSIFAILLNTLRVRTIKMESVSDKINAQALTQSEFKIPNMVCEGCAQKITSEVTKLPGVTEVKPKVMQKQVVVSYEGDKLTQNQIKEAITKSGFNAIEI